MSDYPKIENAPGLTWRRLKTKMEARWMAAQHLRERGYRPSVVRVWAGKSDEMTAHAADHIADTCQRMQADMLAWGRGEVGQVLGFTGTFKSLIECYQTDPDSTYHKLRYQTRFNSASLLRRLMVQHGDEELSIINARALLRWHEGWSKDGKVAMAHAFIKQVRTLFGFGFTIIESKECERLCAVLHKMRFPMAKPRSEAITAEQAAAIRAKAHAMGPDYRSIAIAQAIQFELMLRQKDVIGEWVPMSEPGTSDVTDGDRKWLRGLRWSEIERKGDGAMILRHMTSKRGKPIEVDLRDAPMVMEELERIGNLPASGPIIVSGFTGLPFVASEFRRRWRIVADACGVPKSVKNMDSRAGGATEADEAGAAIGAIQAGLTHSSQMTTENYIRSRKPKKVATLMHLRVSHRNKPGTDNA
jgi:hypothetical protein